MRNSFGWVRARVSIWSAPIAETERERVEGVSEEYKVKEREGLKGFWPA
jgi:hypothetical protein